MPRIKPTRPSWLWFSLGWLLLTSGCTSLPQVAAVCPKLPAPPTAVDLGEDFQDQLDSILYSRPSSSSKPPAPTPYELASPNVRLGPKP